MQHDIVLIVDFGSQVTQLIARRVREAGVYCEIHPFSKAGEAFERLKPKAVILSGGPASVPDAGSPRAPESIFKSGVPDPRHLLRPADARRSSSAARSRAGMPAEFGRADVEIVEPCALLEGVWQGGERYPVWMSHGDRVTRLPQGFRVYAVSENAPLRRRRRRGAALLRHQFHPEVVHTPDGAKLIANFLHKIAASKATGRWPPSARRRSPASAAQVGKARVICGLSGGVDSAVAAVLIHEAIGDQLTCVFVDHGLLRQGEAEEVVEPLPRPLQHPARPCRRGRGIPRRARGLDRSGGQAQDHRQALHRRLRGARRAASRSTARGRRVPRPGHALSRRDRERLVHRRPVGDDQEPPQCRRPARAHEDEARRAAARTLQGRGARARPRARPAATLRRPPPVPRARPRHPLPRRGHARKARHPAQGRRDLSRRDPQSRPLRQRSGRPSPCSCRCTPSA